jgi:cytochrome c556
MQYKCYTKLARVTRALGFGMTCKGKHGYKDRNFRQTLGIHRQSIKNSRRIVAMHTCSSQPIWKVNAMKFIAAWAIGAAAMSVGLSANAQFAKPEDAVKYRKSALTVMAAHFGRLGAMANGRMPFDAKAAAENAEIAAMVAKLPWAAFGEGTDKGETRAKPEIWKEQAKFHEASEKMVAEMGKLAVAAKTGNVDNLKAAFGPAAASCKACHDAFRKD